MSRLYASSNGPTGGLDSLICHGDCVTGFYYGPSLFPTVAKLAVVFLTVSSYFLVKDGRHALMSTVCRCPGSRDNDRRSADKTRGGVDSFWL